MAIPWVALAGFRGCFFLILFVGFGAVGFVKGQCFDVLRSKIFFWCFFHWDFHNWLKSEFGGFDCVVQLGCGVVVFFSFYGYVDSLAFRIVASVLDIGCSHDELVEGFCCVLGPDGDEVLFVWHVVDLNITVLRHPLFVLVDQLSEFVAVNIFEEHGYVVWLRPLVY